MENNEKELLKLDSKELRITSVELVDIINQFRQEEFNILKEKNLNKKDKYSELQHCDFMKKIRKELKTLEAIGLNTEGNFSFSEYEDTTGTVSKKCKGVSKMEIPTNGGNQKANLILAIRHHF